MMDGILSIYVSIYSCENKDTIKDQRQRTSKTTDVKNTKRATDHRDADFLDFKKSRDETISNTMARKVTSSAETKETSEKRKPLRRTYETPPLFFEISPLSHLKFETDTKRPSPRCRVALTILTIQMKLVETTMMTAFSTMIIPAVVALLLLLPITVSAEQPYCGFTAGPCIAGCWNPVQVVTVINDDLNSLRQCKPVGKGFCSPVMNDARIMCRAGTYSYSSDQETAGICNECPKGTYSLKGASECTPCPKDSYSRFSGSDLCTECNSEFSGPGSNAIRLVPMQDGTFEKFCVGGEPVPTVSATPSMGPSDMPSMTPSIQPMQGKTHSIVLNPFQYSDTMGWPEPLVERNAKSYTLPFCIILCPHCNPHFTDPTAGPFFNVNPVDVQDGKPVDGKVDATSIPRGVYPIVAVGGVIVGTALLGCLYKEQKKKSSKIPRMVVVASLPSQRDVYEGSWATSPASVVQESNDVNSTGSLEEVSLVDDDVELGTATLDGSMVSDISTSDSGDSDSDDSSVSSRLDGADTWNMDDNTTVVWSFSAAHDTCEMGEI
jgi:hypothetical protein